MPTDEELRERYPEVEEFAARMRAELWANRGKGDQASWRTMSLRQAWQEIAWHHAKMATALKSENVPLILELAADVANGAMMLDDILHAAGVVPQPNDSHPSLVNSAAWCYCFGTPEPTGPWAFPDDVHADTCGFDHAPGSTVREHES